MARLPVTRQAFIGNEEFVEEACRRAKRQPELPADHYGMREMIRAVGEVLGVSPEHLQTPSRNAQIQQCRELLMYVECRHGVRTALALKETERGFRRKLARVVRKLTHPYIQA